MPGDNVVQLQSGQGSFLASVSLFKMPDGSVRGVLDDMPDHVIEDQETIAARLRDVATWCILSATSFERQAAEFEDPSHG